MKTKWKSRQRFRGRLMGLALASIMAAGCAMAALGGTARAAEPLDLSRKCALQVKVEPKAMEEGGEAESPEVAIDLYKVADAVKAEGYDAYRLETMDSFAALDVDIAPGEAEGARAWIDQARQAAEIVFAEGSATAPAATAVKAEGADVVELADLEPGLYLMVPRGADLAQADYLIRQTEEGGEAIQTIAYSDSYTFTYSPPTGGAACQRARGRHCRHLESGGMDLRACGHGRGRVQAGPERQVRGFADRQGADGVPDGQAGHLRLHRGGHAPGQPGLQQCSLFDLHRAGDAERADCG